MPYTLKLDINVYRKLLLISQTNWQLADPKRPNWIWLPEKTTYIPIYLEKQPYLERQRPQIIFVRPPHPIIS